MNKRDHSGYTVLIVDDEEQILEIYSYRLKVQGISNIICLKDSREVLKVLGRKEIDVMLLDLTMPHLSGKELLSVIKNEYPDLPVIIVTGTDELSTAVEYMRTGAFDYLVKPVENSRFMSSIQRALEIQRLRQENRILKEHFLSNAIENPEVFSKIITCNERMKLLFRYIESISKTKEPVLISGETGVGKEMIADAVHVLSGRNGPYVKVNVSGLDDSMFTDTLFGHKKGAYTGASESREGLIKKASKGTLFLDEIGDLSARSQVKLLRLLEGGEYFTLGSDEIKKSNARVVAATNTELTELVDKGKFRKDLYYRLSAHQLEIPPLRERREDIPLLIEYFVKKAAEETGKEKPVISKEVYAVLQNYSFPGNIRELRTLIFDAVSRNRSGKITINLFNKIETIKENQNSKNEADFSIIFTDKLPTLKKAIKLLIEEAVNRSRNQQEAARLLGISPAALSKRLKTLRTKLK